YVVNFTGGSAFNGDTTTVTMTGPATFTGAAPTGVTNNPANCSVSIAAVTTTSYQYKTNDVVAGGVALVATTPVTLTATRTGTGTGRGRVPQTANNGFSGPSKTATATGLVFTPATVNAVTKACTIPANPFGPAGSAVAGTALNCTLTITFAAAPVVPTTGTIT